MDGELVNESHGRIWAAGVDEPILQEGRDRVAAWLSEKHPEWLTPESGAAWVPVNRLVLDASVLLSAVLAKPGSKPSLLLDAVRSGAIELVACDQLLDESRTA